MGAIVLRSACCPGVVSPGYLQVVECSALRRLVICSCQVVRLEEALPRFFRLSGIEPLPFAWQRVVPAPCRWCGAHLLGTSTPTLCVCNSASLCLLPRSELFPTTCRECGARHFSVCASLLCASDGASLCWVVPIRLQMVWYSSPRYMRLTLCVCGPGRLVLAASQGVVPTPLQMVHVTSLYALPLVCQWSRAPRACRLAGSCSNFLQEVHVTSLCAPHCCVPVTVRPRACCSAGSCSNHLQVVWCSSPRYMHLTLCASGPGCLVLAVSQGVVPTSCRWCTSLLCVHLPVVCQ
jgi:hypothetical protein